MTVIISHEIPFHDVDSLNNNYMQRLHRIKTVSLWLLLLAVLAPVQAIAEDTLINILKRLKVQQTEHFSFHETRLIQLLAEPWQATGDMFMSPTQMVIAQHTPTSAITVISEDRLLHVSVEEDIYSTLKLKKPFAVPGMEPLMQVLYGNGESTDLQQNYNLELDVTAQRWVLQLTPRHLGKHSIISLRLSGANDHGPDQLILEQADGDSSEWQLTRLSQGTAADRRLGEILNQLSDSQLP